MMSAVRFGVFSDPGAVFTLKKAAVNTEDPAFIETKEAAKARFNSFFDGLSDDLLVRSLDSLYKDVKDGSNTSLLVSGATDAERIAAYQTAEMSLTKRVHSLAKPPKGSSSKEFSTRQGQLSNVIKQLGAAYNLVINPEDNLFRVLKLSVERLAYGQRAAQIAEAKQVQTTGLPASLPTTATTP